MICAGAHRIENCDMRCKNKNCFVPHHSEACKAVTCSHCAGNHLSLKCELSTCRYCGAAHQSFSCRFASSSHAQASIHNAQDRLNEMIRPPSLSYHEIAGNITENLSSETMTENLLFENSYQQKYDVHHLSTRRNSRFAF